MTDMDMLRFYEHWHRGIVPFINLIGDSDKVYREISEDIDRLSPKYKTILERLSPDEQDIVECYIAAFDQLDDRFAQLLYNFLLCEGVEIERKWLKENHICPEKL